MFHYEFTVPYKKQYRVIVHTDCKNEADDQFTVAHAQIGRATCRE